MLRCGSSTLPTVVTSSSLARHTATSQRPRNVTSPRPALRFRGARGLLQRSRAPQERQRLVCRPHLSATPLEACASAESGDPERKRQPLARVDGETRRPGYQLQRFAPMPAVALTSRGPSPRDRLVTWNSAASEPAPADHRHTVGSYRPRPRLGFWSGLQREFDAPKETFGIVGGRDRTRTCDIRLVRADRRSNPVPTA